MLKAKTRAKSGDFAQQAVAVGKIMLKAKTSSKSGDFAQQAVAVGKIMLKAKTSSKSGDFSQQAVAVDRDFLNPHDPHSFIVGIVQFGIIGYQGHVPRFVLL